MSVLSDAPIFIVGAQRSGTTWLQSLLLRDQRLIGGQESHFFVTFARVAADFDRKNRSERRHGLACYWTHERFLDEVRGLWSKLTDDLIVQRQSALVFLEKTPDHALVMPFIREVLPKARFVHMVRDSRAVASSLLAASRDGWGRSWAPKDAKGAALQWRRYVESARASGREFGPDNYIECYFERLKASSAAELDRVYQFIGLPTSVEQLEKQLAAEAIGSRDRNATSAFVLAGEVATDQYREPEGFIRKGEVDSWRRDLSWMERRTVWAHTKEIMVDLGYSARGELDVRGE